MAKTKHKKATANNGKGKAPAPKKFTGGPIGPIEGLPGPEEPPIGVVAGGRIAGAVSVQAYPGRIERDLYPDNPALRGQKVLPVSDNASAHGYNYVADVSLYNLYDEMVDREPVIASALEMKVAYLLMRPQQLNIPERWKDDTRAGAIIDFVRKALIEHDNFPAFLWSLATGVCQHGRSTMELVYEVSPDGYFVPKDFYHCHPGQFRYKRTGEIGLIRVAHVDEEFRALPEKKFVFAKNPAVYDNPHGKSDLHVLRFLYYIKKKGYMNFVRVTEKNGVPFVHIEIPEGAANLDAVKADLEEQLGSLTDDDAFITEFGYKVNIHDRASSVGERLYVGLLENIDRAFLKSILGAELQSSVADRGARSLGEVHERTVLNKVLPLARHISVPVNRLIAWLVEWNFGPEAPVPYWEVDTEEKTNAEEARETLKTAKELGIEIAVEQAREWLGIRPVEPGEEILPATAAPDVAAAPGEEEDDPTDNPPEQDEDEPEEDGEDTKAGEQLYAAYLKGHREAFSHLWQSSERVAVGFREAAAKRARGRQETLSERLELIGQAAAKDSSTGLIAMAKDLGKQLRKRDQEEKLDLYRTRAYVNPGLLREHTDAAARNVVFSAAFLSLGMNAEALQDVRPEIEKERANKFEETDFLDSLPEDFRAAVEWMSSREVMTVAAVRALAQTIADELQIDWKDVERGLRSEVLALAGTTNTAGTRRVQTFIADAVNNGETVGSFLDKLDGEFGLGEVLPEGQNAYWNNVFRTETANAYSQQQQENEADPEFRQHLWGHEMFNIRDDRSRPGHARLSGLRFKLNSTAHATLGAPPFAYQCRCTRFALMAPGGRSANYIESASALSAAASVERF